MTTVAVCSTEVKGMGGGTSTKRRKTMLKRCRVTDSGDSKVDSCTDDAAQPRPAPPRPATHRAKRRLDNTPLEDSKGDEENPVRGGQRRKL
ncbi:hypothetical protein E2C01_075856 [Portunus trituberculatus]|uniref:Uncharacterized protein n=1 Tax=Portunus trituberculatus TaxID=210409 RepID=A0A5B7IHF1_PORTR|nr:hypothetical protein [Portunus trituberculatus]